MLDLVPSAHFVIRGKGPLIIDDIAPDLGRRTDGFLCLARADGTRKKIIWVISLSDLSSDELGIFQISLLPDLRGVFEKHPILKLTEPQFCPVVIGAPLPETALCKLNS